jgi:hypothetical protein
MALPGPSRYQKQAAVRRRTGDITRLADQYQRNVQAVTGEYEQAFSQFQAQTRETMAPYEEALGRYTAAMPEYEKQAAAYAQRLSDYQGRMQAYNTALDLYSTRTEKFALPVGEQFTNNPQGLMYVTTARGGSSSREANQALRDFGFSPEGTHGYYFAMDPSRFEYVQTGSSRGGTTGMIYRRGGPDPGAFTEQFTETAPTAPQAPTAPEVPAFDSSQFEARRGQIETEFKREIGERRSARQRAVSRGGARPLLQGRA